MREVTRLNERRVTLLALKKDREDETARLKETLRVQGIDPEHPAEEVERLSRELNDAYQRVREQVTEFEGQLAVTAKTMGNQVEIPTSPQAPETSDLELS